MWTGTVTTTSWSMTSLPDPLGVVAGDVDDDGDVDLVVAATTSQLLLNDGINNFTAAPGLPSVSAVAPTLVDLSGDGILDVYLDDRLYQQSPVGSWALVGQVLTGISARYPASEVRSFDFDLDGDLDTITASGYATTDLGGATIGTFTLPVSDAPHFQLADVDVDGDVDLLTSFRNVSGTAPSGGRYSLLINRSRRLAVTEPLRPGRPLHIALGGAPNGAWLLFASTSLNPVPAPPYGTIFLNLGGLVQLAGGSFDPAGAADVAGSLPASFAPLAGLEVDLQAIVDTPPGPRLTNAERTFIFGY